MLPNTVYAVHGRSCRWPVVADPTADSHSRQPGETKGSVAAVMGGIAGLNRGMANLEPRGCRPRQHREFPDKEGMSSFPGPSADGGTPAWSAKATTPREASQVKLHLLDVTGNTDHSLLSGCRSEALDPACFCWSSPEDPARGFPGRCRSWGAGRLLPACTGSLVRVVVP